MCPDFGVDPQIDWAWSNHVEILVAILGGLIGGFMNTVASSGSVITLPLLVLMGLPPAVANGTNRLPVFFGAMMASIIFMHAKVINWHLAAKIMIPTLGGSIVGAIAADHIRDERLNLLIAAAVVIALLLLFTGAKKAFGKLIEDLPRYRWQEALYLFCVGIWLGLIVLDSATYLLLILILSMRLPLVQANAYKNLVLCIATGLSLIVMSLDGNVDWEIGGLMALGSVVGGFIGARFAMHELAKKWTYRFLVAIISLELVNIVLTF